jgi:hypothetical protein
MALTDPCSMRLCVSSWARSELGGTAPPAACHGLPRFRATCGRLPVSPPPRPPPCRGVVPPGSQWPQQRPLISAKRCPWRSSTIPLRQITGGASLSQKILLLLLLPLPATLLLLPFGRRFLPPPPTPAMMTSPLATAAEVTPRPPQQCNSSSVSSGWPS